MKSLYVTSTSPHAGKSLISLVLGLRMKSDGLKVGYMKPVGALPTTVDGVMTDEDALFIAQALEAPGKSDVPVDVLCPVLLDSGQFSCVLEDASAKPMEELIMSAFSRVAATCKY